MAESGEQTQLGQAARPAASPDEAVAERVPDRDPDAACALRFAAPAFAVACPIAGQPDLAHQFGALPEGVWLPDQDVAPYGRRR